MTRPRFSEIQIVLAFVMLTSGVMALPDTEIPVPLAVFLTVYFAFVTIVLGRISGRLYEPGRYITFEGKVLEELRTLNAAQEAMRGGKPAPTPATGFDAEAHGIEIPIVREESR